MAGKCGVVPQQLEDAAPERELRYLYGTAYRFSDRTRTDSLRPREGSRARAGQPLGR